MIEDDEESPSPAALLLAEHLLRLEAGEQADFELLCRQNPAEADELRRLELEYRRFHGLLLNARPREEEVPRDSVIERLLAAGAALQDSGNADGSAHEQAFVADVLAQLALRSSAFGRYRFHQTIQSGGMGIVQRVWDDDLGRWLAMKRILDRRTGQPAKHQDITPRQFVRFLEEARIAGQLSHPGVLPIYELGVDPEGCPYFTMKLVESGTLESVLKNVGKPSSPWTLVRVIGLLVRICETMSYAHSRKVIHRDLKPSNVLVGDHGEVYVVDWGLVGDLQEDQRPEDDGDGVPPIGSSSAAPAVTQTGDVLGTPAFMPPELARGEIGKVDKRADVYALGGMLYQLLAGFAPYHEPTAGAKTRNLLKRVAEEPPVSLRAVAPKAPAELVAICETAMERDREQRYPTVDAMAEDLNAYLEGRVISSEIGAWVEARKWVRRNKRFAAALCAAVVAVAVGAIVSGWQMVDATVAANTARRNERDANEQRDRALEERAKVRRLSDVKTLQELESDADSLWPPHPNRIAALREWSQRATELVERLPLHRSTLDEMRAIALPWTAAQRERDSSTHPRAEELARKQAELEASTAQLESMAEGEPRRSAEQRVSELQAAIARLSDEVHRRRTWTFAVPGEQWHHDVLAELIANLERLHSDLLAEDAISLEHGWSIPKRIAFARSLEAGFAPGGPYATAWAAALPAIQEMYPGLDLKPQMGLLPIGPDPKTGLWEFAHLMTGAPAQRGPAGELAPTAESGLVLVLIPGDTFWMGAQAHDPSGRNYDPQARSNEGPVHEVELSPHFISKYEMSQEQWGRLTGRDPSWNHIDRRRGSVRTAPVEMVSYLDCLTWLPRAALVLPTEAQWEHAARGGTDTPWWTGAQRESIRTESAANLADKSAGERETWGSIADWPEFDDGYIVEAPVGSFSANPFGLHEVIGNVMELCEDAFEHDFYRRSPRSDPAAEWTNDFVVVIRGGSYMQTAMIARSASREGVAPLYTYSNLGVRPAKDLDR